MLLGSGIRCLSDAWIRDPGSGAFLTPGSGMGKNSGSGSGIRIGMNNPDHISESLETIFWVKILKFFDLVQDPGYEKRDMKNSDPGETYRIHNTGHTI